MVVSWKDALKTFSKENKRLSNLTIDTYVRYVRQFFQYIGKALPEIKQDDIEEWLKASKNNGQKPTTLNVIISTLRTFFAFCYQRDYISDNPTIGIKKVTQGKPIFKPVDEKNFIELRDASKSSLRNKIILEMLACTGMRVSELIKLKWDQIIGGENAIRVVGKRSKEKIVFFSNKCRIYLDKLRKTQPPNCQYIFLNYRNKPLTRQGVHKILKKIAEDAEVDKSVVYPHNFRKYFMCFLLNKNVSIDVIAELAGIEPDTMEYYAKYTAQKRKQIYDTFN